MTGSAKLMTAGGGGVLLQPATTTATDVTVKVPVTGVNNGTLVCSDSSGNVGIGTSSPAVPLDVRSSGFLQANFIAGSANGIQLNMGSSATPANWNIYASNPANYFAVQNGTTERMRIDSSGNLLVGTTGFTPGQNGTQISKGAILSSINTTAATGQIVFYNPNGAVGQIYTNGSSTVFATSSDYRLKENIQPMQNALGVVAQLNPVTYTWKADGSDGQGFIAHELQAVVPDCVTGEKDAVDAEGKPVYQGIDTSFLVGILTKAIQEQQAQIETLTAKVTSLEAK